MEINVRQFIQNNYTPYYGDEKFLSPISKKTFKVWEKVKKLLSQELESGVLDIETKILSGIDNFQPGYIDKDNEVIVGLQTDKPLKRSLQVYGGIRMAEIMRSVQSRHTLRHGCA